MLRFVAVAFLAHLSVLALNPQTPKKASHSSTWKYELIPTNRDPQKLVGKLTYKNKEVAGHEYDRIATDLGTYMWRPPACDKNPCGWYRINPQKKYPRWRIVIIDESENGAVWHPVPCKFPCTTER